MKKLIKILCWVIFPLFIGAFCFARFAEYRLIQNLPEIFQTISSPSLQLSIKEAHKGQCWTQICINLKELTIQPQNQPEIKIDNISIKIPLLWPIRATIKTTDTSAWKIDATFKNQVWDIRTFYGQIAQFKFNIHGKLDIQNETGELIIQTTGLKNFLSNLMELPVWMKLLIQNIPQQFVLKPDKGTLWFQGIPILQLNTLKQ
jgi:hypothetical protein